MLTSLDQEMKTRWHRLPEEREYVLPCRNPGGCTASLEMAINRAEYR
jgi:hypothetical protein